MRPVRTVWPSKQRHQHRNPVALPPRCCRPYLTHSLVSFACAVVCGYPVQTSLCVRRAPSCTRRALSISLGLPNRRREMPLMHDLLLSYTEIGQQLSVDKSCRPGTHSNGRTDMYLHESGATYRPGRTCLVQHGCVPCRSATAHAAHASHPPVG